MEADFLFDIIEQQAEEGIGFMAIHCGINLITLERLRKQGYRYGGLVSRGGSFLTAWMNHNKKENPLYEQIDRLIDIMKKHDVILSLGNGLRAGAIHDSTDRAQIQELIINSEIAEYAQSKGVQIIVEGPGHIPIDEIEANVLIQKRLSNNAPFYMPAPLPQTLPLDMTTSHRPSARPYRRLTVPILSVMSHRLNTSLCQDLTMSAKV